MKTSRTIPGFLAGILAAATAFAQAPAAEPTDPGAASTPHQRQTLKKPVEEAPPAAGTSPSDAATPHQKQVLKKKHKKKSHPATTPSP